MAQSGSLGLTATPQPGTDYIYTTVYYAKRSTWLPVTLTGSNAAPSYSSGPASGSLSPNILSQLTPGTNYLVLWDWLWDATAQCYKGPGLNQCNTGTWRVQTYLNFYGDAYPFCIYTYSQSSYTQSCTSGCTNYYISTSGSDSNSCAKTSPCQSINSVNSRLGGSLPLGSSGTVIHVAPGTYSGAITTNKSGSASARIRYISDTQWGAKIVGSGCGILRNTGDYVDIVGCDMTGPCSTGLMQDGNYGRIIGNRVHDLPGAGGYAGILVDCCSYHLTGNQVIGNVVDNVGPFGQSNLIHGIYVAGNTSVVENNIVTRAAAACISTYHGATHEIISNNTVANCGKYGIQISADGAITSNDYTTVDNNIVVNVAGLGIQEYPSVGTHNVYNHNIVYNNTGGDFALRSGTQSGNITLTSAQFSGLFINYTGNISGDYHLKSGAAAIDAGTVSCASGVSSCVPSTDFDGKVRPNPPSIGAYEQ